MIRSYLVPWAAKIRERNLRWVFRNLTSDGVRGELLAKRIDFGILRKDGCPAGLTSVSMKPIPMCLLLPADRKKPKEKLKWEDLAGLEGYSEEYVIAWSRAEAAKRPEIGRLARHLGGR